MGGRHGDLRFREVQRVNETALPWYLALAGIPALWIFGFASLRVGEGTLDLGVLGFAAVVLLGPIPVSWVTKLVTEVREDGIYVSIAPFPLDWRVTPEDVTQLHLEANTPGGRGLQFGGFATDVQTYTVHGDGGVRIERDSGAALHLGSTRPQELLDAVQAVVGIEPTVAVPSRTVRETIRE